MKSVIIRNISESDGSVVISMSVFFWTTFITTIIVIVEKNVNNRIGNTDSDRLGDMVLPNPGPKLWYYLYRISC